MKISIKAIIVISLTLTSCSSLPNLQVGYYLPKSSLEISVTQTGACTDGNIPILTTDISLSPSYSRDDNKFNPIQLSELDGCFSKGNATFTFYGDGRLKAVNTKQTSQTADSLKSFLKIASAVGFLKFAPQNTSDACKTLNSLIKDEKKGLSIVYRGHTDFPKSEGKNEIKLNQLMIDNEILSQIEPIFGSVTAYYTLENPKLLHINGKNSGPKIKLVEPARAKIEVILARAGSTETTESYVWVPQYGKQYELPLQDAPLFGENEVQIELSESGRVTKLSYSSDSGASAALGAITEIESSFESEATKEKSERLKAEADLIYQQQRLVQCQTDPTNCVKWSSGDSILN